ncbi:SemiSWEET family transporter [Cysteiniphilum sp. JM-1]|uniref:SemiSWEET family transporter n=1 Tax=Cysteiniphilum sp. JM-1 TaxID=2610891 RepID=UPI0012457E20|nr:SemiSWEET family transporter [Cysteiniphilum sp. JM-1]
MLVTTVGWIATVITVIYTLFGLPMQIRTNFKRKSAEGLSLLLFCFLFLTFLSWVFYGGLKSDYFIVVPNGLGAFFAFIVLGQIILYSKRQEVESSKKERSKE